MFVCPTVKGLDNVSHFENFWWSSCKSDEINFFYILVFSFLENVEALAFLFAKCGMGVFKVSDMKMLEAISFWVADSSAYILSAP